MSLLTFSTSQEQCPCGPTVGKCGWTVGLCRRGKPTLTPCKSQVGCANAGSLLRVVHSMGCLTGALHFMPVKYAVWCRRGGFMGSSHMSALLKESREADGRLMSSLTETDRCITTTCVMSGNMQSYSACVETALAYLFALFYPFLFRRPARLLPKAYWPSYLSKWPPSSVHWNWSLPKILVLHRGTSEILSHKPCFHLTSPSPARKTAAMNHCMRFIISLVQQSLSYCLTEYLWLWLKALVALWLILKENSSIYVTLLKRHFVVKVISSWAHLWSVQEFWLMLAYHRPQRYNHLCWSVT